MLLFRQVKDQFEIEHARKFPGSIARSQVGQATTKSNGNPKEGEADGKRKTALAQSRRKRLKKKHARRK
jgi:hypothetical protein